MILTAALILQVYYVTLCAYFFLLFNSGKTSSKLSLIVPPYLFIPSKLMYLYMYNALQTIINYRRSIGLIPMLPPPLYLICAIWFT